MIEQQLHAMSQNLAADHMLPRGQNPANFRHEASSHATNTFVLRSDLRCGFAKVGTLLVWLWCMLTLPLLHNVASGVATVLYGRSQNA